MGTNEDPLNAPTPIPETGPAQPAREERANPKYIAVIALVAVAILLVGAFLRPKDRPAEAPVSQTEMMRLRRLSQKTSLESMTGFFSEMAAEISPRLVRLQGMEQTGLSWQEGGSILTAAADGGMPQFVDVTAPTGVRSRAQTTIASPDLPIALLQTQPISQIPRVSVRSLRELKLGQWVLAIARQPDGGYIFAPGWYGGSVPDTCGEFPYLRVLSNLSITAGIMGGGLFDLDGNLVGLVIQCSGSYVAMAAAGIDAALQQGASFSSRLLRRHGMKVQPLNEALRAYFNSETGFLVTEVWKGYSAEAAGLAPGDVIIAVDGAAGPKDNLRESDLEMLVQQDAPESLALQVRRGRRTVPIALPGREGILPAGAAKAAPADVVLEAPASGYRIESVAPDSRAAQAGVQPGDRLLRIGSAPVTNSRSVERALSSASQQPVFVVLDRGYKLVGYLLP
ncbi:MAG: hypothetical protein A3H27_12585 [Acidobacteria bacterium RIFCSPLOWO2_02_FULL_59_13]|nr:MAG: hypothetical protein A3H27_12585 [Acidobacteria bacterium RIFCSPLOWO2_02_FULL_59_13]